MRVREVLNSTFMLISAAAGLGALWISRKEFEPFFGNIFSIGPLLFKVLVWAALAGIGWNLLMTFCQWVPKTYQRHIYPRTKNGRLAAVQKEFASLQGEVEDLLINSPLYEASYETQDEAWTTQEEIKLEVLLVKLKKLEIPVPDIQYDPTLKDYLSFVAVCIHSGNLERCIRDSKSDRFQEKEEEKEYLSSRRKRSWMDY